VTEAAKSVRILEIDTGERAHDFGRRPVKHRKSPCSRAEWASKTASPFGFMGNVGAQRLLITRYTIRVLCFSSVAFRNLRRAKDDSIDPWPMNRWSLTRSLSAVC
jgi:hypothetical protein